MGKYVNIDDIKKYKYPEISPSEETDTEYFYRLGWEDAFNKIISDVENTEGEWIKEEDGYIHCSICNEPPLFNVNGSYNLSHFCPNCGEKMK